MRNEIILLSGKAGAGKDTLADVLVDVFSKRKGWEAIKVSFALPIYQCHNLVVTRLQECGIKVPSPEKNRKLLQLLGTDFGRTEIGENVWVDCMKALIADMILTRKIYEGSKTKPSAENFLVVISDCRFMNEFDGFPEALRVRLECGEYARKNRAASWDEARKTHLSETDLDAYAAARKFDLELNTAQWNPGMCAELVTAQIDKNCWKEKRK